MQKILLGLQIVLLVVLSIVFYNTYQLQKKYTYLIQYHDIESQYEDWSMGKINYFIDVTDYLLKSTATSTVTFKFKYETIDTNPVGLCKAAGGVYKDDPNMQTQECSGLSPFRAHQLEEDLHYEK